MMLQMSCTVVTWLLKIVGQSTIHNQSDSQPVKQCFSVLTTLSLPGEVVVAVVEAAGTW